MSMRPIVHGGGVAAAAQRFGGRPQDWLDLSTGINPCPAPLPPIEPAAWQRLPDRHLVGEARTAAARHYGAAHCLPLPVPGTQSVIQHLPRLVPDGRRAAILSPTYGEYARVLANAGVAVDAVSDLDAITDAHGLAVVVNPNNPDGRRHARADLVALWERMAGNGSLLLVDEAFADMRPDLSLAPLAGKGPGLAVLRSFGKFFGMAGLRLGFVLGDEALLDDLADRLGPWAVSGPALAVAAGLLAGDKDMLRETILARKLALDAVLSAAGLTIAGGTELFTLVSHPDAAALHEALCRRHILVRTFDYETHWLRIGLPPDIDADRRLAEALGAILP